MSSTKNSSTVFVFNTPIKPERDELIASPNPKQMRSFSQDSGFGGSQENAISDDEHFEQSLFNNSLPPIPEESPVTLVAPLEETIPSKNNENVNDNLKNEFISKLILEREIDLKKRREENEKHEIEIVGRITAWYAHLTPILRAARERSFFDIHAYGREIVSAFTTSSTDKEQSTPSDSIDQPVIPFSKILENRPKDLTARYFLSVLQLANTENIKIIPPANRSRHQLADTNELKIKLLNPNIRLEAMDESLSFECCEPIVKKRKIDQTLSTINPVDQIIKKCSIPQKKNETIEKLIEKCKINPQFVDVCRSYTGNQLISAIGKMKNSTSSEFGDSGFESLNSSLSFIDASK